MDAFKACNKGFILLLDCTALKLLYLYQVKEDPFAGRKKSLLFWVHDCHKRHFIINGSMKKIRLTDESVNKYGFRVLTSGLDLTEFKKNPIMFFGHNEWGLPIGKWEEIDVKNGEIHATPVFDETDDLALKIKSKWEQGMLNAASIGFSIIEISEDPKMMVKGQTRPTITKARLREVSIVNVPANSNAYKLHFQDETLQLSEGMSHEKINLLLPNITQKLSMKNIALQLGLAEDATEAEILAALSARKPTTTPAPVTEAKTETPDDAIDALVALAESKGLVADPIRQFAKADYKAALSFVKGHQAQAPQGAVPKAPALTATELIKLAQSGGAQKPKAPGREDWTFQDWRKKDPNGLRRLQAEQPEQYEQLKDGFITAHKSEHPQWFQFENK